MSNPEQPSQAPHDPTLDAAQAGSRPGTEPGTASTQPPSGPSGQDQQTEAGFQSGPGYQADSGYQAPQPDPTGYQYQAPGGPRPTDRFFDSVRRTGLVRTEQRWVGGVAGGLARRLDVDPVLVRCVWAVLCVFTGVGLIIYGLGWALMPEERDGRIHVQQALDGDVDAGLAGAIAAVVAGIALSDRGLLPGWFFGEGLGHLVAGLAWLGLNVAVVCLVVWAVARAVRRRRERRQAQAAGTAPGPVPPRDPTAGQTPWPAAAPQPAPTPSAAQPPAGTSAPAATDPASAADPAAGWPGPVGASQPAPSAPRYSYPSTPTAASVPVRPIQPVQPPRPPKPRAPGPGRTVSLMVLGLMLLALAASVLGVSTGTLGLLGAGLVAAGAVVGLLGLGVTVSALRGRRGGWMTGFGWLAALVCVPVLVLGTMMPTGSVEGSVELRPVVHTVTEPMLQAAASTPEKVLDLGSYGAADVTIDLTRLSDGPYPVTRMKVTTGTGVVRVVSKQTQSIELNASTSFGKVYGENPGRWSAQGAVAAPTILSWPESYDVSGERLLGTGIYDTDMWSSHVTLRSQKASETEAELTIDATVGLGAILVQEQRAGEVSWSGYMMDGYWIVDSWTDAQGEQHASDDLPVPGMTHPAVSSAQAHECLVRVKAVSAKASSDQGEPSSYEEPDGWVTLDSLNGLSPTGMTAMASCLDHVIDTGSVPEEENLSASVMPSATPVPSHSGPTAPGGEPTESAQPGT
ncbi:PspC domain-containing protein [Actinomyces faecalis]|uniref:PspC domain-containing protein n=1 Tax=Actinomyces faecalis TaxID=2722820 RepID=UPI0015530B49|nr:PspC domain-containing protein [Actinomyces faecalis]